MSDPSSFADFIRRIRAGYGLAAEELVRRYEPLIRREIRLHLADGRLGRLFDSMDVCQSVLRSFFVRTASAARDQHRQKRDNRRTAADEMALAAVAAAGASPSRVAADRDLLDAVRKRLTAEERVLADLRGQGHTWEEIAERVGGNAQARRVQLARALSR